MRVLWFEVTVPGRYKADGLPVGGWQDSLEYIIRQHDEIELYVAFEGRKGDERKTVDGVTYIPIVPRYSKYERLAKYWTIDVEREHLLPLAGAVMREVQPDIIHVFGSEWCWGQIQQYTFKPVVIHMQGSIPPYQNAAFPPGYNLHDMYHSAGWNLKRRLFVRWENKRNRSWVAQEEKTFGMVGYYMGRTSWDHSIVKLFQPRALYYYCAEALRPSFIENKAVWQPHAHTCIKLVTTGVSSLWKGLDTILRTARMLRGRGFNFEWYCAGSMPCELQKLIEQKEHTTYAENNVKFTGLLDSEALTSLLLSSDMYVHTAYIDNSPNAVCEAQYLGLPIIATYVGGIPSLIENGREGVLVPANDPFTMAGEIMKLAADKDRCAALGQASRVRARKRHDPEAIYRTLTDCYRNIIKHCEESSLLFLDV